MSDRGYTGPAGQRPAHTSDEARVVEGLRRLEGSELVLREGTPPDATYTFKHALIQDTAYESLLRKRRQEFHARIARRLETGFPEIVKSRA